MDREIIDLLWLGYEDVSGLWEITWQDRATGPTDRRIDTLVALLRSGLIEVARGPWSLDFDDARRLTSDEARRTLLDERCWKGPDPYDDIGEHVLRFVTTDAGFEAYREATVRGRGGPEPVED
ncbi:hypothetical protein ACFQ80_05310 [Isoptericola sp. NPDC056578]|uniref:hypothetical protein n=1 Tax=Isoptericola sp. NPDC056578 TaxID=3345870 RepID=UPI0036762CC8